MAAKKKTRLTVTVEGQERQLLSINEKADGSLTLHYANETPLRRAIGPQVPVQEQHWSVHRATTGTHTTIKHTLLAKDGELFENAALVIESKDSLAWPIFCLRVPDLRQPAYGLRLRRHDTAINVECYNPDEGCLLVSVVVTSVGIDFNLMEVMPASAVCIEFSLYKIWVVKAFFNAVSMVGSHFCHFSTNEVRVNRAQIDPTSQIKHYSMSDQDICLHINLGFIGLGRQMVESGRDELKLRPDQLAFLSHFTSFYTARPIADQF